MLFSASGLILLEAAYLSSIPSLVLLIIFSFIFTIIQVVFEGRFQHAIPGGTRATISSLSGFVIEILVIIVYFTVGTFAEYLSYRGVFAAYGILITALGMVYILTKRGRNRQMGQII